MIRKLIIIIIIIVIGLLSPFIYASSNAPPHPINITPISSPPQQETSEKVLVLNFSIKTNDHVIVNKIGYDYLNPAIINTSQKEYRLEIWDDKNNLQFFVNLIVIFNPKTNLSKQYFSIPDAENFKYIYIYHNNSKIFSYTLSSTNKKHMKSFCGDGRCTGNETMKSCPQDCQFKKSSNLWLYILAGAGVLILLFVLFTSIKVKRE